MLYYGAGWKGKSYREYGMTESGPSRNLKYNFVLLEGRSDINGRCWLPEGFLLFQMPVKGCKERQEFAFVQYTDVTPPRESVDWALRCVYLQCTTDEDNDHTFTEREQCFSAVVLKAGELLCVKPNCSVRSTLHVARDSVAVASYSKKVPRRLIRFYSNRFLMRPVSFWSRKESSASFPKKETSKATRYAGFFFGKLAIRNGSAIKMCASVVGHRILLEILMNWYEH